MKLVDLNKYNKRKLNRNELAVESGISWAGVNRYLSGKPEEPSLPHVARLLTAMGVDISTVTLADLLEEADELAG